MSKEIQLFKPGITADFIMLVGMGSVKAVQHLWDRRSSEIDLNAHNPSGETPLMIATLRNDLKMVQFLLGTGQIIQATLDLKHPIYEKTAYELAMDFGYTKVADLIRSYRPMPPSLDSAHHLKLRAKEMKR
ncbi:MAG TPA: ankyrin repeat domain-containing protein [Legionellaceae bacterium]|nr:ankyrin repeat domain-containing protein [Legionellaceae bacterium]